MMSFGACAVLQTVKASARLQVFPTKLHEYEGFSHVCWGNGLESPTTKECRKDTTCLAVCVIRAEGMAEVSLAPQTAPRHSVRLHP